MKSFSRVGWILSLFLVQCAGTTVPPITPGKGLLDPCPGSPNCVSTQATDPRHRIAPYHYTTTAAEARERLLAVLRSLPRTRIQASRFSAGTIS